MVSSLYLDDPDVSNAPRQRKKKADKFIKLKAAQAPPSSKLPTRHDDSDDEKLTKPKTKGKGNAFAALFND